MQVQVFKLKTVHTLYLYTLHNIITYQDSEIPLQISNKAIGQYLRYVIILSSKAIYHRQKVRDSPKQNSLKQERNRTFRTFPLNPTKSISTTSS